MAGGKGHPEKCLRYAGARRVSRVRRMNRSTAPTVGFVMLMSVSVQLPRAALVGAAQPRRQAVSDTLRIGVARQGGGYTVRSIPIDEYVAGVLAGEAARESGTAALEALAITVRTYALANRGRHAAEGFDLCDLTHCQVLRNATAATERAAAATARQVLVFNGA